MAVSKSIFYISVLASALIAEPRFIEADDVTEGTAAQGALTQLEGQAGCVDNNGEDGCADGRALNFATRVAASRDGKNAYVASGFIGALDPGGVAVFARDRRTGAVTQLKDEDGCLKGDGSEGCAFGRAIDWASAVEVSRDGKNVYVSSIVWNAVAVFARDRKTGALAQLDGADGCVADSGEFGCADGRALNGPRDVAVSPDGRNVYATFVGSNAVAVFARNSKTAAITQLKSEDGCVDNNGFEGCADGRALSSAFAVAVSPDGKSVYVVSSSSDAVAVFARNRRTGALTQLKDEDGCIANDGFEGCDDGRALNGPTGVVVSRDGKSVYVASFESDAVAVFARNLRTGALSQLDGAAGCVALAEDVAENEGCAEGRAIRAAFDVGVSRDRSNVYVTSAGSSAVAAFARNRRTGALTQLMGEDGCVANDGFEGCADGRTLGGPGGVAVSQDDENVYVTSSGSSAVAVFARRAVQDRNPGKREAPLHSFAEPTSRPSK